MTPNGSVFGFVVMAAAMVAGVHGLALLLALVLAFAAIEVGARALVALKRAGLVMAPLAAFMLAVWVGIVGRAPDEIAAGAEGSRAAALLYVATVCARLFLIVFVVQAVAMRFEAVSPFEFIRALRVPMGAKRLIVLTLSLIETLRHAVDRSHTALVASGVITRRFSLRNLVNGWVLVQTVWLTTITAVTGRMRDKWPTERTLTRLDPALAGARVALSREDITWLVLAAGAAAAVLAASVHGTA